MWNYYLVQSVIMNTDWIEENGDYWAVGRVEYFDDENSYGYSNGEYGLMIDGKDWIAFDDYLRSTKTTILKSLDELIAMSELPIVRFQNRLKSSS